MRWLLVLSLTLSPILLVSPVVADADEEEASPQTQEERKLRAFIPDTREKVSFRPAK